MGEPYNGFIEYSIPLEADESGVDAPCYEREFDDVDTVWQLAHEDVSWSAHVARQCVIAAGLTPHEKMADNIKELDDANVDTTTCSGE